MPAPVIDLASSPSTNGDLAARLDAGGVEDWTAVRTLDQTAGRGRADRSWVAPAGTALALSIAVPVRELPAAALGWVPLAAGVAVVDALGTVPGVGVAALKWPNDVLVGERKVSGILAELRGDRTIVGIGVNLVQSAAELPVPTAASLRLLGAPGEAPELADRMLGTIVDRLRGLIDGLALEQGDAAASGLADAVATRCATIGRRVRVELPGGRELVGTATGLDADGRIVVDGTAVAAGDIVHLRPQVDG